MEDEKKCPNCGHDAYHCPASGCNHHDEVEGWCDCDWTLEDDHD